MGCTKGKACGKFFEITQAIYHHYKDDVFTYRNVSEILPRYGLSMGTVSISKLRNLGFVREVKELRSGIKYWKLTNFAIEKIQRVPLEQ